MIKDIKHVFTLDYDKRALKIAKETLQDARQELIKAVQEKLIKDAMVSYSINRVNYLESVVGTLTGAANGETTSITAIDISPVN